MVYTHVGNDDSALKNFTSALKRDGGSVAFRHNRAMVNRRFGNYMDAKDDYVKLWMERNVNGVETSPWATEGGVERPRTMSSFRAKSRDNGRGTGGRGDTANISAALSMSSAGGSLTRPLTGTSANGNGTSRGMMINQATLVDDVGGSVFDQSVDGSFARGDSLVGFDDENTQIKYIPKTEEQNGRKMSSHLSMTKQEMIENEVPEQKPVHAMDPRELTKLFFNLTAPVQDASVAASVAASAAAAASVVEEATGTGSVQSEGSLSLSLAKKKLASKNKSLKVEKRIDLTSFKTLIGAGKGDIYEEIFHKPSDLQVALLKEPETRKPKDVDEIFDAIKNFEICRNLDTNQINGVCQFAEYRTAQEGSPIFQQGENVDCCVILLTGGVDVKIESDKGNVNVIDKVDVGEVSERSERVFWKTIILAIKCAKWLHNGYIHHKANPPNSFRLLVSLVPHQKHFGDSWLLMGQNYRPSRESYVASKPCQLLVMLEEHFNEFLRPGW